MKTHNKIYYFVWLFKKQNFHFISHVFRMHVCLCTTHIRDACGGEKKACNALELVLWMLVTHHVDAGNRTWVLCKSKCS